ncbi:TPA: tail fiber assembly protein, partial [Escherichia coli]|nr:phage tail protein [Escherichia coli]EIL8431125.1 phage tail protein [Escherichia coli]EIL9829805.1 phage tail protein [Escherichia coli]EJK0877845.1 phage tail protein [Escherichia coli]EKL2804203.1 phage tail protein [Escherichia coli]
MELRNITRYYPEEKPYGEGIQYFRSEDGQDFYESLDKFTKKYKLCIHPETGVIYSVAEDVSRLYPVGFTIVEVDALPEG